MKKTLLTAFFLLLLLPLAVRSGEQLRLVKEELTRLEQEYQRAVSQDHSATTELRALLKKIEDKKKELAILKSGNQGAEKRLSPGNFEEVARHHGLDDELRAVEEKLHQERGDYFEKMSLADELEKKYNKTPWWMFWRKIPLKAKLSAARSALSGAKTNYFKVLEERNRVLDATSEKLTRISHPIMYLALAKADDINQKNLEKILSCIGYSHKKKNTRGLLINFQIANFTPYQRKKMKLGELNEETKTRLYKHFLLYQQALQKYPDANIDSKHQKFGDWVAKAAENIKNLPVVKTGEQKLLTGTALFEGLIHQETGNFGHFDEHKVTVSKTRSYVVGAIGFTQLMPYNAFNYKVNPYEPADNLKGGAMFINCLLGQAKGWLKKGEDGNMQVAKALAFYNGGRQDLLKKYTWEEIVKGDKMPSESIHYAIKIRKRLKLPIRDFEKNWLNPNHS
ncbi:hypothetical protein ACFL35_04570 [Candidatus Riflebacteria bacterium]